MKTTIKILLLILFFIGAIAGVLVYAKTRVAPPSEIEQVDQYRIALEEASAVLDSINGYEDCKAAYMNLDDKIRRFRAENVIDDSAADFFRVKTDTIYGNSIIGSFYTVLGRSEWPENVLNNMIMDLDALRADRLSTGETAVPAEFTREVDRLHSIMNNYQAALRLVQNTSFRGIRDATRRINLANNYKSAEFLRNNTSLVRELNELPARLAQAHYYYVSAKVNSLREYQGITKENYDGIIVRVNGVIEEYKQTRIYGNRKPNVSALDQQARGYIQSAMIYYTRMPQNPSESNNIQNNIQEMQR